ncbi:hypothetical protein [Mesorhizobium sp. B2-7-1]|uniref:hypothetical protein n=1 Tax=Mesorhizobium sp. B2-7-1 TaxID=2589909 RepID=UPI001FEE85B2|nr:hypothetical protein [Mesorhizobium sp. B2-7-1]
MQPQRLALGVKQLIAGAGNDPDRDGDVGVSTVWEQCRRQHQEGLSSDGPQL